MSEYLESYGRDRKRTAVFPNAWDIIETKKLNQVWELAFKLPGDDEKIAELGARRQVRYQDGELYRIVDWETSQDEAKSIAYTAEHVIAMLSDRIMHGEVSVENLPTSEVLRTILSYQSDWVLGECDFEYLYGYAWVSETLLNAMWSVPNCFPPGVHWRWVTDTKSYPYKISLKKIDVTKRPDVMIIEGLNQVGVRKPTKTSTICNRVYPKGRGEGVNQTDIRKVNNGIAYIEDVESQKEYGLIEREYVDRSIEEPQRLLDVAKAYLDEAKKPLEEYEIESAEVFSLTGNRMYRPEPGDVLLLKKDGFKSYVTEVRMQHDKAGDLSLTIANKPQDLTDMLEDIANKARIESTYAQGSTILWGAPMSINADAKNPMKYPLWMPKSIIYANVIHMKEELSRFRTDSKGVKSGGGTAKTTGSGGGQTITSYNAGEMEEEVLSTSGATQGAIGEEGKKSYTGATAPKTMADDALSLHAHATQNHRHSFDGQDTLNWGHQHELLSSTAAYTGGVRNYSSKSIRISGTTGYASPQTLKDGKHTHQVNNHTHEMDHWHLVKVGITIPPRPGHAHRVEVAPHTHKIEIPDHVHEQVYGIYMAGETPESARVKINGVEAFTMGKTWEGDITQWMVEKNGEIPRGKFVDIEVTPNVNAFVTVAVAAQAFISGKEGGQY